MQGCMGLTFLCGWGDKMSFTDIGECQWILREGLWLCYCYAVTQ